jgi:diacylglycerol kinase (ATP)
MTRPAALVLLNPAARGGTAVAHFARVQSALSEAFSPRVVRLDPEGAWRGSVETALRAGVRSFVAAGGDGTVGALATTLVERRASVPLGDLTLAAVGLGSSNDYHKPVRRQVAGVPVRLDARAAGPRDLALARWESADGHEQARAFVVSASLGLAARANAFFTHGHRDPLLRVLKSHAPGAAILYAAVHELARAGGLPARLTLPTGDHRLVASSLSVTKTPYLAGCLRFDTPVAPDSGALAVNVCEWHGPAATLRQMIGLAAGRFRGRPGTRHWMTNEVAIALDRPDALELDGEVVEARHVRFAVLAERIRACA